MSCGMCLLTSVVAFLLLCSSAHADLCFPPIVQKDSPYHYTMSLIDALSYAKSALRRMSDIDPKPDNFAFLLALKLSKADFECATSQVSPYVTSSNEAIHGSAKGVAAVFSQLAALNERSVAVHRSQRDEILQKLQSTFGDEVKKGMQAGQHALIAAAGALYQIAGDPKRKLRDP